MKYGIWKLLIRSRDDEFEGGFTEFEFIAANQDVRSALRQTHGAIDESAVGAAQVLNEKLVALRDDLRVAARDARRRVIFRQVDFRANAAIRVHSSDQVFAVGVERELRAHLVGAHHDQPGRGPLGRLARPAVSAEDVVSGQVSAAVNAGEARTLRRLEWGRRADFG